jgi:hypothetical protein
VPAEPEDDVKFVAPVEPTLVAARVDPADAQDALEEGRSVPLYGGMRPPSSRNATAAPP